MLYNEYLKNKYDYQEQGRLLLLERKHAFLYYKPGKGKTYPCIDAIRDIVADRKNKNLSTSVLVLSTADAIKNMWFTEIVPQNIMPEDTVYLSFTAAIQDKTKIKLLKAIWNIIVVDESHKIKSHNAQISKLVYQLTKKSEYAFGLSGTPRGNADIDIYCQFHNMNVSEWGKVPYTRFVEQCCQLENTYIRGGQCIKKPIGILPKYQAGWDRNMMMYTQRVDYVEEDKMPDLNVNKVLINYHPTKQYIDAEEGIIRINDYESTVTKLAAIVKAQQAANGYLYIADLAQDDVVINKFEDNKKLEWLENNLTKQSVIVYRFKADLYAIQEQLIKMNYTFTEDVNTFKAYGADILLLQCSRCESFNLQMCKRIIFYTLDYSYIKYDQMLHRVWRMGQNENVQIDVLLMKDTVEEKIWRAVKGKEKLANLFMSIKY